MVLEERVTPEDCSDPAIFISKFVARWMFQAFDQPIDKNSNRIFWVNWW